MTRKPIEDQNTTMESLEELRDNYKGSRGPAHIKVKENGATYSLKFRDALHKVGNSITKSGQSDALTQNLNHKYAINENNLAFSLNKKGRWNMVDELKDEMNNFQLNDVDVRLYETRNRIKASKNSENLVGLVKSKGKQINIKSTYANTKSIVHNESLVKKSPKEETKPDDGRILINVEESKRKSTDDQEYPYVQYDVEYPPKIDLLKYTAIFEFHKKESALSKKLMNVLGDEVHIRSLGECRDCDDCIEIENEQENEQKLLARLPQEQTVSLEELIQVHANQIVQRRKNQKAKHFKISDEEVKKLVYIQRQNSSKPVEIPADSDDSSDHFMFSLNLRIDDFSDSKLLADKYGSVYAESFNTLPRICAFNLTDEVNARLVAKINDSESLDGFKIWLIIIEKQSSGTYDVTVKTNLKENKVVDFLDELNSKPSWQFDELYGSIVAYLAGLPMTTFGKKVEVQAKKAQQHHNFKDLQHISTKHVCKEFEIVKNELLYEKGPDDEILDDYYFCSLFDGNATELACSICFDENLSQADCTTLKTCSHSICNKCWVYYVDSWIANAGSKPLCPACDEELEIPLIIRFASDVNRLDRFISLYVEKILFLTKNYKWCSSPTCNKIIKVDLATTPYGIVSCECGYKCCLKCNMEPHFPAKCSQIAKYYDELKLDRTRLVTKPAEDELFKSVGCKCPICSTFIEKNGGCNHMTCTMCKTYFCWNCLKPIEKHDDGECKRPPNSNVYVEFVKPPKRAVKTNEKKKKQFHDLSVEHREARSLEQSTKRNMNINRLLKTIKPSELHKFKATESQDLEKMSLFDKCKLEIQKRNELRQFLQIISSFLNELHFVCEYGYVLLTEKKLDPLDRNNVFNVLKSIEILINQIDSKMNGANGLKAVGDLEDLMQKGLSCLSKLSLLNI